MKGTTRIFFGLATALLLNGAELGRAQTTATDNANGQAPTGDAQAANETGSQSPATSRTINFECRLPDEDRAHPSPITIETGTPSVTSGLWVVSPRWGYVFCTTKNVDGAYAPVYVWEARRVANNDYHTPTMAELGGDVTGLVHDGICKSYYEQEGTDTSSPFHQVVTIRGNKVTWGIQESETRNVVDMKTGELTNSSGKKIARCSVSRGAKN